MLHASRIPTLGPTLGQVDTIDHSDFHVPCVVVLERRFLVVTLEIITRCTKDSFESYLEDVRVKPT